jgi:hypothetical protein
MERVGGVLGTEDNALIHLHSLPEERGTEEDGGRTHETRPFAGDVSDDLDRLHARRRGSPWRTC